MTKKKLIELPTNINSLKQVYENWKVYWENGDADSVVSYYTDDTIQMPDNEPEIVGKAAYRSSLKAFFDEFRVKGNSSKINEVEGTGNLAFVRGTYVLTVTAKKGGKATKYSGKFLHIFKRQRDGYWRIYRAIGFDDQVLPL
jgi:uncharacterized protein (TIGR02246 family)